MGTAARTRHLIIPGLAKAGTTFLFEQLAAQDQLFGRAREKEINYFVRAASLDRAAYLAKFPPAALRQRILLDASPGYIQKRADMAHRIRATLAGDDVHVAILLRDPVAALYSHYLHDLKSTIGRPGWAGPRPAAHDLHDPGVLAHYLRPRAEAVRTFRAVFGPACRGFPMPALFDGRVVSELATALGVPIAPLARDAVANRGGFVPRYLYGGAKGAVVEQAGGAWRLPPGVLLFLAEERSSLHVDVPPAKAAALSALGESFTSRIEIPARQLEALIADHRAMCDALDVTPLDRSLPETVVFTAPPAGASAAVLAQLDCIAPAEARIAEPAT